MDRDKVEKILTCFQAYARGYLVRNEVRRARADFEDIVKEIDGGLTHLQWRETVVPFPRFTDTDGLLDVSARPQRPPSSSSPSSSAAVSSEDSRDHRVLLEKTEAERDDSQVKGQTLLCRDFSSAGVVGDGDGQKERAVGEKEGGVMESSDSTTVWSSLELDRNSLTQRGAQQYRFAQEVPCTPEALRLHRNTLTMELLWLQQAIDSRKKYLSVKDRLSVS